MANFAQGTSVPTIFNFQSHQIRTIVCDGAPWFVAKDVCDALGYANSRDAIADHLDADERSTVANSDSRNGGGRLTIINESGLYALVLRSRKPAARKFAKWVTAEVLPAIRKTGGYGAPDPQRQQLAQALAAKVAGEAMRAVTEVVMSDDRHPAFARWVLAVSIRPDGSFTPYVGSVGEHEFVASIETLTSMIASPGGGEFSNKQLVDLAAACNQRLAVRMECAAIQDAHSARRRVE